MTADAFVMIPKSKDKGTAVDIEILPLVLCKNCKHRTKRVCDKIEFYECDHIGYQQTKCGVTDDWFCADGEPKEA